MILLCVPPAVWENIINYLTNPPLTKLPPLWNYLDVWEPAPIPSKSWFRYYVCFIDSYSRYTCLYLLVNKSQVFDAFLQYKSMIELKIGHKIKALQSDNGREYLSNTFTNYLTTNGISHYLSCPYSDQQNGYAERKHRHITKTGLSLLATTQLPLTFWVEAFTSATYLINRLPSPNTQCIVSVLNSIGAI